MIYTHFINAYLSRTDTSEETYPGSDPAAGNITLRLTKTPQNPQRERGIWDKVTSRIKGETTPQRGHFDIARPDGSTQAVNSENQNCLFHAVIQATTKAPDHVVKEKAKELRSRVSEEIRSKPAKYANAVKIQNMFNQTSSCNKFKIEGGLRKGDEEKYKNYIKNKRPQQIINECKLGNVGEYKQLTNKKKPTPGMVEADHIPPKKVLSDVHKWIDNNKEPKRVKLLKEKNKDFCEQVMKMENDLTGNMQICMNTLYYDHRRVLTTGSSGESTACRDLLVKTFQKGDVPKGLKLSLMMAHPQFSDNFRKELGIHRKFRTAKSGLTQDKRNQFYKDGFTRLGETYSRLDLPDAADRSSQRKHMKEPRSHEEPRTVPPNSNQLGELAHCTFYRNSPMKMTVKRPF
ncbi:uncharacterized protein LOC118826037 [Colossoma macropomum]|uniref:uncharacterized protein LOC118826037 n=1 Tax=Colossoma macropomum TaxID=42526 RepID=UPI001864F301|nr:uncharacterized protein LOC118826037 [Colossoma macropomum]